MTSRKWNDSGLSTEANSRWLRMGAESADGSVCKRWNHFTQSVQSHKPWKVREASGM